MVLLRETQEGWLEDYRAIKLERDDLLAARDDLLAALENIAATATVIPDPAMDGTTDTYSVPLDDIEAARDAINKAGGAK